MEDIKRELEIKKAGLDTRVLEINDIHLKKYLFLFMKGHLSNGLNFGQVDDMLELIMYEVNQLFLLNKYQVDPKDYPYAFDKDGNQIGCDREDYK